MFIQNNNQNDATAKVGKNDVLAYENAQDAAKIRKAQQNILRETDVINYSVSSATLKTQLYALFSVVAGLELAAALFFYGASFGLTLYTAISAALAFSVVFHLLTHSALKKACIGLVFEIENHSKAATFEIVLNVVIAFILLSTAACTVYFIGKPSFEGYRNNTYKNSAPPPPPTFTAAQMTNKNGKINTAKVTAVTNLQTSYGTNATNDRTAYDKTTAKISDIVGTSAFFIELILAVLAFGIATAKRAATIEIEVRKNVNAQAQNTGAPQPETHKVLYQNGFNDFMQPQPIQQPQMQTQPQRRQIGFQKHNPNPETPENKPLAAQTPETHKHTVPPENKPQTPEKHATKQCECANCKAPFTRNTTFQKYCTETCRIKAWELRHGKTFNRKKTNQ